MNQLKRVQCTRYIAQGENLEYCVRWQHEGVAVGVAALQSGSIRGWQHALMFCLLPEYQNTKHLQISPS